MTEIIREIDEELQAKHYGALAKKYGKYVGAIVLLLGLSFGGYGWWQNHTQAKQERRAASFAALLGQETPAEAWVEFAASDDDAFGLMAWRFAVAGYLRDNRRIEAAQAMQNLSNEARQDSDYRAFAEFTAQILALNSGTETQALQPEAASPFAAFAALAEAERFLRIGDRKAAIAVLQSVQEADLAQGARSDAAVQTLFSELIGALQSTR